MLIQSQRFFLLTALGATFFSCGTKQQAGMMGGVPEYATITLEPTSIELNNTYPAAAIRGRQDIEIRPNVSGFITKLCVDEGATVKKGQTLFIIDPVQFEGGRQSGRSKRKRSQGSRSDGPVDRRQQTRTGPQKYHQRVRPANGRKYPRIAESGPRTSRSAIDQREE